MTIETKVYKILNENIVLTELLKSLRSKQLADDDNGIWKHDIPENYRKEHFAPFIRLNPIFEGDVEFYDDESAAEEQRIQISFWTKTDAQSELVKNTIDKILKENNLRRYTANENPRYKDPDIDLITNIRKYRFFDWEKN